MSKEYKEMVTSLFKTEGFDLNLNADLHAAVGVAGEAGEVLDLIKKSWAYNKDLDYELIIEELGDLEFYLEALRQTLCISRKDVLAANISKLGRRYSNGTYSDAQAIAREDVQRPNEDSIL